MEILKKLKAFGEICAYVLATIGGVGYSIYGGSWPIAIAIVVLGVMAFPEFKNALKELQS